jgi:arylformamidase
MRGSAPWIDISVPLKTGMVVYPGDPPINVSHLSGENQEEVTVSHLSLCVHAGTHIDAPLHFIRNGRGIDQMPAVAMIGPARVLAITDSDVISIKELEGQNISQGERILFKTRNSALWGSGRFEEDYVYLATDAASLLVEKGIMTVGIDYLSISGFNKNESEVHQMLLKAGIWIIEGLNLSAVEPGWYDLVCLPLMITGAEAAPARAMVRSITHVDGIKTADQ